jgi:uncharacterized membrane protein
MSSKVIGKHKPPTSQQKVQIATAIKHHEGPLPAPEDLAHYNQIVPGFAERIVFMAEEESSHRRVQEKTALDADISFNRMDFIERRIGQIMGFTICVSLIILGFTLVLKGFPIAGTIFGGVGMAPVIWAFVPRQKENKNK